MKKVKNVIEAHQKGVAGESGFSLMEILVGTTLTGIFLAGAIRTFNEYTLSRIQAEGRISAQDDTRTVERWLTSKIDKIAPGDFYYPKGVRMLSLVGTEWATCPDTADCLGMSNFQFLTLDEDNENKLYMMLNFCMNNGAADWPDGVQSRIAGNSSNCHEACPRGQHPVVLLERFHGTYANGVVNGTWEPEISFPNDYKPDTDHLYEIKKAKNGKLIAMSMCSDRVVADNSLTVTVKAEYFVGGGSSSGHSTDFVESVRTYFLDHTQMTGVTAK